MISTKKIIQERVCPRIKAWNAYQNTALKVKDDIYRYIRRMVKDDIL